ncbi:putative metal-dependent membrane protease [Halalkaliarchaeum desulfuricum]|uniref:Putative metal-dependent membrane protease n=1 Tax=Halalkaliarchaeum desulfuricum TaxID=2055893 RepID=A0A343TIA4_9EURY|nr:CPBP family intramembrane glutamic endopeptidase [Halalkaliarchaeum desulfuricum]AUX08826.1 putative metal-dependent membrane protease [Halalkaliarchaeum desulfuricum]
MPDWTTFTAFAAVTAVLVLVLARASQSMLVRTEESDRSNGLDDREFDEREVDEREVDEREVDEREIDDHEQPEGDGGTVASGGRSVPSTGPELTTTALLANVAVSQGAFLLLIALAAWLLGIPAWAFGVSEATVGVDFVALGVVAGVVLYVGNEAAAAIGKRHGFTGSEELRRRLAPDTVSGWVALLFVVLPLIAVFEELLFRGALIGVAAAGFDVSPWLLAVVSSIAFGFGHGAQGRLGIVVTGVLGFLLAVLFIVSGSLLLVIVAHYVINALEFLVHEALGWEPFGGEPRSGTRSKAN